MEPFANHQKVQTQFRCMVEGASGYWSRLVYRNMKSNFLSEEGKMSRHHPLNGLFFRMDPKFIFADGS